MSNTSNTTNTVREVPVSEIAPLIDTALEELYRQRGIKRERRLKKLLDQFNQPYKKHFWSRKKVHKVWTEEEVSEWMQHNHVDEHWTWYSTEDSEIRDWRKNVERRLNELKALCLFNEKATVLLSTEDAWLIQHWQRESKVK